MNSAGSRHRTLIAIPIAALREGRSARRALAGCRVSARRRRRPGEGEIYLRSSTRDRGAIRSLPKASAFRAARRLALRAAAARRAASKPFRTQRGSDPPGRTARARSTTPSQNGGSPLALPERHRPRRCAGVAKKLSPGYMATADDVAGAPVLEHPAEPEFAGLVLDRNMFLRSERESGGEKKAASFAANVVISDRSGWRYGHDCVVSSVVFFSVSGPPVPGRRSPRTLTLVDGTFNGNRPTDSEISGRVRRGLQIHSKSSGRPGFDPVLPEAWPFEKAVLAWFG